MVRDGISERTVWRAEAPHERVFFGVGAQCIDLFIQMLSLSTYSVRGAVLGARTQLGMRQACALPPQPHCNVVVI